MTTGRSQMLPTGDIRDWGAVVDQVLRCLVLKAPVPRVCTDGTTRHLTVKHGGERKSRRIDNNIADVDLPGTPVFRHLSVSKCQQSAQLRDHASGLIGALVSINEVALRWTRLLLGWVNVCGQVSHLCIQPTTQVNSALHPSGVGKSRT